MHANAELQRNRCFLKDSIRKQVDFSQTPQNRGIEPPPPQKPFDSDAPRTVLPAPESASKAQQVSLVQAIRRRRSRRDYSPDPLTLSDLSFLLWAVQGLRQNMGGIGTFRTVPSAGARHAFETYLCALNVNGLDPAVYRYLPLQHALLQEREVPNLPEAVVHACMGQTFAGDAAAVFAWSAVPARMEWRYGMAAHKAIALDAGHVVQNLYLACEALEVGTCAIAAYDQDAFDDLLGLDGDEEFVVYLAPVGRV